MSARGTFVAVVLAGVLGANRGWACDEAAHARAAQAERDHQLREAIDQRTDLLRCAGGARAVDNLFALASDHAALRNALRAAEFGERAAEQAPTDPRAVAAMTVAAGYRLARGELPRAEFDVHWLLAAGNSTEAASTRALEVGAALEQARQWSAAVYWYDWLLTQFTSPEQESVWQRALSGLYRAVDGRGVAGVRGGASDNVVAPGGVRERCRGTVPCRDAGRRWVRSSRRDSRERTADRPEELGLVAHAPLRTVAGSSADLRTRGDSTAQRDRGPPRSTLGGRCAEGDRGALDPARTHRPRSAGTTRDPAKPGAAGRLRPDSLGGSRQASSRVTAHRWGQPPV